MLKETTNLLTSTLVAMPKSDLIDKIVYDDPQRFPAFVLGKC